MLSAAVAAQERSDACHVYVVDVEMAKTALNDMMENGESAKNRSAAAASQTILPEFRPAVGEEKLTTKTYPFPGSKLFITASVFYTDESMASSAGNDSMLLGVVVSPAAQKSALAGEGNAVAEVTLGGLDTVRTKTYVRVQGKLYLVGLECRSKPGK